MTARRIARSTAATHADSVDAESRFPAEAIGALRRAGLLGAAIPVSLGGLGASFASIVAACYELGQCCSSTALVFAMHQIQVISLLRHKGESAWHERFLSRVAAEQLLLASATTESSSGGDIRRSECAVRQVGDRALVEKAGCVISYAEHADAVLVTARRSADGDRSDQVAILAERDQCRFEQISHWDALGMRGTCSQGFNLAVDVDAVQVMPAPYAEIAAETMLPVSHTTWAAVWLGIAEAACSRARNVVRRRRGPGSAGPAPGALRLSQAMAHLQAMRALVGDAVRRFEAVQHDVDSLCSVSFTLGMNQLKLATSTALVDIVGQALLVAGLAGYRNDSPDSIGRHLRDAHSAALMIGNDRILSNSAALLAAYRGGESLFP